MTPRWQAVKKLLAIRLDNLGDVLMATPALAAIRRGLPEAELSLLASPSGAALKPHLPMLDAVIAYDAPWVKGGSDNDADFDGSADTALVAQLAAQRFDAAVIFTTCTQSALPAALLCRLAGIPLRLAHCRENPYRLLSDWVRETDVVAPQMRHEVERQLALVGAVGFEPDDERLVFAIDRAERHALHSKLAANGIDPARPHIVVHVGASAPSRRYPAPAFGAAAELIGRRSGACILFTGDAAEQPLIDEARNRMGTRSVSLAGQLTLGELGALIADTRLLVSNNTGPAHIAAAVGTPVVDLYALTNPQHTPWRVASRVLSHDVPCRNCLKSVCPQGHHHCLRKIDPQQVAAAAFELLGIAEPVVLRPRVLTRPSRARLSLPAGCNKRRDDDHVGHQRRVP
jgi:lipopolysaccharide heptosyltransferase II